MSKNHNLVPHYGKAAKKFVAYIESLGYAFDRVNSKGICFYSHETLPEERVNARMTDAILHDAMHRLQRLTGNATKQDASKRDVARVKERQSLERERAANEHARLEVERLALIAEREQFAARFGANSTAEARGIVARIERNESELSYWASLMTETPNSGHRGREHAKHRA